MQQATDQDRRPQTRTEATQQHVPFKLHSLTVSPLIHAI